MRRRPSLVLLVTVMLGALVGGCGSDDGARSSDGNAFDVSSRAPSSSPRPTSRPRPMGKPLAGYPSGWTANPSRKLQGKFATLEPLASRPGFVRVAASEDLLAVADGGFEGLTLRIGELATSGPLKLTDAEGASRIPWWARVHVGSDASGRPVVTYPRCRGARYVTCTAMAWSPAAKRERPIGGLDDVAGVLEVAQDAGVVAARVVSSGSIDERDMVAMRPRLLVRMPGSPPRRLPGPPVQGIELHGDTLGVIRDVGADAREDIGICGMQDAALWSLRDLGAGAKVIDTMICGLGGQYFSGMHLDATSARIMMAANAEDAHPELRTYRPATGELIKRRMPGDVPEITWLDARHGLAIGALEACDARIDVSDPSPELRDCPVARITLREP